MKKTLKNNFGITYVSVAKESFFRELDAPVNKKRVIAAKKFFKDVENVKVDTSALGFKIS